MSHYKILGVSKDATKIAIRAAYLQKAKRYHPDINQSPQAEKLFKAVQEAYQVLNNDLKKRDFDASSHSSSADFASEASVDATAERKSPRYKGRVYDPEKERSDFSKEFYEQAEALRKEMENDRPAITFSDHATRILSSLLWRSLPYVLFSSISLLIYNRYKASKAAARERSTVLHDMYGRAYITDRFGRRVRSSRYDDKARIAQWKAHQLTDKTLELNLDGDAVGSNNDSINTNPITINLTLNDAEDTINRHRVKFTAFDRIDGRKRSLSDSYDDDSESGHHGGHQAIRPLTRKISQSDILLPAIRPIVAEPETIEASIVHPEM